MIFVVHLWKSVSIHAPAKGATGPRAKGAAWNLFQSTPPRRGRPPEGLPVDARGPGFNPRPREGGDIQPQLISQNLIVFQSTPPRRGRHRIGDCRLQAGDVSIHAPAKGATGPQPPAGDRRGFQSTPPRRGRPGDSLEDHRPRRVSIHAPAKGATEQYRLRMEAKEVSIHAPAKGATISGTRPSTRP